MDGVTNMVTASSPEQAPDIQGFILHHMANGKYTVPEGLPFSLPNWLSHHGLMVVFSAVLLVILLALCCRRRTEVPHGVYNLLEFYVKFIRDHIAIPHLGEENGRALASLFCSFFMFILTMNLVGLVPCFYAATSNVNVTGALASVTLAFMIFGAIYRQGVAGFMRGFVPHGVPWPVLIILVPIEMLGLVIKSCALMIRLFANMLAGHLVIFSLLGLVVTFGLWALPAVPLALFVYLLEVMVALLQAYIFTLLSAIFIGQRLSPEH